MWPNQYGRQVVRPKLQKGVKIDFFVFLPFFGVYIQPDDHIGWATWLPFASIYPTYLRTNPWNFRKKILRIGRVENLSYFELAILIFLLHPYSNQSQFMGYQGWDKILMITLVSSKKLEVYKIIRNTVLMYSKIILFISNIQWVHIVIMTLKL